MTGTAADDPGFIAWSDQAEAARRDIQGKLRTSLGTLPEGQVRHGDRSTPIRAMMADLQDTFPEGWVWCSHVSGDRPAPWIGTISTKMLTCQRLACIMAAPSLHPLNSIQEQQCDACGVVVDQLTPMMHKWGFIVFTGAACSQCVGREPAGSLIGG